jgi:hypothetical protein
MKIRPVGAEFFMRSDRRTDKTKLIVAFLNIASEPKTFHVQNSSYNSELSSRGAIRTTASLHVAHSVFISLSN